MSALSDKQAKFARMTALLILHAEALGHRVRFGECWRHPDAKHGHRRSLHKSRLAVDLILDKWDEDKGRWVYQRQTKAYTELGEYWESIGGAWGGRFQDGNHFSLEHGGRK